MVLYMLELQGDICAVPQLMEWEGPLRRVISLPHPSVGFDTRQLTSREKQASEEQQSSSTSSSFISQL